MLKTVMQYWMPVGAVVTAAMTVGAFGVRVSDMRSELDSIESVKPAVLAADVQRQAQAMAADESAHVDELRQIEGELSGIRRDLAQVRADAAYVRGIIAARSPAAAPGSPAEPR